MKLGGVLVALFADVAIQAGAEVYPGAPHGLTATHRDAVNEELLSFFKGKKTVAA